MSDKLLDDIDQLLSSLPETRKAVTDLIDERNHLRADIEVVKLSLDQARDELAMMRGEVEEKRPPEGWCCNAGKVSKGWLHGLDCKRFNHPKE